MGDAETLETPKFIIRWTTYIRNAFDSKAFKAEHAKLYADYTRYQIDTEPPLLVRGKVRQTEHTPHETTLTYQTIPGRGSTP